MTEVDPIRLLQEASLGALTRFRDEIEHLFSKYIDKNEIQTTTLKMLFHYLFSRSQTVSFLLSHDYCWDAEIVLRTFYEASAKILFICFSKAEDKGKLVDEFWGEMGPIFDRRAARKAAFAEKMFDDNSFSAKVFLALQNKEMFDLEPAGSKKGRRVLEQKWSFSEIVKYLEGRANEGKRLHGINGLLYIYGMASHLVHADRNALLLMHDRATRATDERDMLKLAHAARIMLDQVSIAWLCTDALREHLGGEFSDADALRQAFQIASEFAEPFDKDFEGSQRDFYASWAAEDNQSKRQ